MCSTCIILINGNGKYDIIIRRNTWVDKTEKTIKYSKLDSLLKERLQKKNIKTVNLIGYDGNGKKYLIDFLKKDTKLFRHLIT